MRYLNLALLSLITTSCAFQQITGKKSELTTPNLVTAVDDLKIEDFYKAIEGRGETRIPATSVDQVAIPSDYQPGKIFSVIKEPSILSRLESKGFSLQDQLGFSGVNKSNKELLQSSLYNSLVNTLENDLKEIAVEELKNISPKSTTKDAIATANKNSLRVFDIRWLKSAIAKFELVGVINRMDRVAFDSSHCGEIRFIYRLAYENSKIYSRMPFTLMVKYFVTHDPNQTWQEEKNENVYAHNTARWNMCKRFANQWVYPKDKNFSTQPGEIVDWITSENGPLAQNLIKQRNFKSIEINLQALRVPSGARSDLAGHGVYLLRVFGRDQENGELLVPQLLENTPDVKKINQDTNLKQKLFSYLKDEKVYNRLDKGNLVLPNEYLGQKAISYSPFGIARKDNRLFEKIFSEAELKELYREGAKYRYIQSPGAVARRLNDMSCVGCHQGRATAGFHFLGIDKATTHQMNALIFEGSGHFETELKRRYKYLTRVNENFIPSPNRDFSIAPPKLDDEKDIVRAGYGHFCGLKDGGFERWVCEEGLECQQIDEAVGEKELGKCYPAVPKAGDPCFVTQVKQMDHQSDKLNVLSNRTCGGDKYKKQFTCSNLTLGHPAGTCYKPKCESIDSGYEICGYLAGEGFNQCMQSVFAGKKTFVDCAVQFRQPAGRGLCNEHKACRNDYVCVRSQDYIPGLKNGYCAPSYFLFQVRHDGHISPE